MQHETAPEAWRANFERAKSFQMRRAFSLIREAARQLAITGGDTTRPETLSAHRNVCRAKRAADSFGFVAQLRTYADGFRITFE